MRLEDDWIYQQYGRRYYLVKVEGHWANIIPWSITQNRKRRNEIGWSQANEEAAYRWRKVRKLEQEIAS